MSETIFTFLEPVEAPAFAEQEIREELARMALDLTQPFFTVICFWGERWTLTDSTD